jgi:hypothetical protein
MYDILTTVNNFLKINFYLMKKTALILLSSIVLLVSASCKKTEVDVQPVTTTVSALLKTSETYTYTLPQNVSDDAFQITAPAGHSSMSQLTTNATGNLVYQYTPAVDFTGTDNVVISTVEEEHNDKSGKNMHNGCGDNQNQSKNGGQIIKISLTVIADK